MMKKILLGVMALMMGCLTVTAQKSIVILYENDVHCGIDGYTKMAGLRDAINRTDTAYARYLQRPVHRRHYAPHGLSRPHAGQP